MEKTLKLYRPITVGRTLHGIHENRTIERFVCPVRLPEHEPDEPGLAKAVVRACTDDDGNILRVEELAGLALAEGIKAAVRPFWKGML